MRCLNCQEENPDGASNCSRCGVKLEARACPRCGGPIRGKSRFCMHCGNNIGGETSAPRHVSRRRQAAPPPQAPPPRQGSYPPPQTSPQQYSQPQYPQPQYPPPGQPRYQEYDERGEQASYTYEQPPETVKQTLRDKTILLKEQFGQVIKKGNYQEVLRDKNHPATQSFIDFIAWGITHFYGFAALVGAITFLGILMGGWGVVFGLALAFVYATYKKEIDQRVEEIKGGSGGGGGQVVSYSSPAPAVDQPRYRYTTARTKDYYYQIHNNCTSCGVCVPYCPSRAISQISQQFLIDQTRCNQCGDCEYQCPVRAIVRIRD